VIKDKTDKSRSELLGVIHRQQHQISALEARVQALEAEDVGQLRQRVEELESWKLIAEKQIEQLESKAAMTQGLVVFAGVSVVALLGEKIVEIINSIPLEKVEELIDELLSEEKLAELEDKLGKEKFAELEAQLGGFMSKVIDTIHRVDKLSLETWQRQWKKLERRAATLPPLKRALFHGLKGFASPSELGTLLLKVMSTSPELVEKLTAEDRQKTELIAAVIDKLSNLWPLTITNSLAPLLKFVGFDDAAEASGEIIDQLEAGNKVPRHLVHKVRHDLVAMGVFDKTTKPSTIIEYFTYGFRLQELGCSPDEAAEYGYIPWSATQLKRAKRAYEGLHELYNRIGELPVDSSLETMETFEQSIKRIAAEKVDELRDLFVAELN
jgi:hypothetical protein